MSTFIQLDRVQFLTAMTAAGFTPDAEQSGNELVLSRQHHVDPTMWVKIYTSLPQGGGNGRSCGSDAIRVLLIFRNEKTGRSGCLFKATRVHRTGTQQGVIDRTIQRAREAYGEGNKRLTKHA